MVRKMMSDEEVPDDELFDEEDLDDTDDVDDLDDIVTSGRGSTIAIFGAGVLVGALIGAGAALLTAPARGEVTRKRVRRRIRDARDDTQTRLDELQDEARRGIQRRRRSIQRRQRRRKA